MLIFIDLFFVFRNRCELQKSEVYLYELIVPTPTANYATYRPMEVLYGRDPGGKLSLIILGITDNV